MLSREAIAEFLINPCPEKRVLSVISIPPVREGLGSTPPFNLNLGVLENCSDTTEVLIRSLIDSTRESQIRIEAICGIGREGSRRFIHSLAQELHIIGKMAYVFPGYGERNLETIFAPVEVEIETPGLPYAVVTGMVANWEFFQRTISLLREKGHSPVLAVTLVDSESPRIDDRLKAESIFQTSLVGVSTVIARPSFSQRFGMVTTQAVREANLHFLQLTDA